MFPGVWSRCFPDVPCRQASSRSAALSADRVPLRPGDSGTAISGQDGFFKNPVSPADGPALSLEPMGSAAAATATGYGCRTLVVCPWQPLYGALSEPLRDC